MTTQWKKLKDETPIFEKYVVVKTEKNVYIITKLISITSSKHGIDYRWDNKVEDVIEWCEIPE